MTISAAQVKELRERTGSGMMECKKALVENNGDIDQAAEWMRKNGMAKADKKAGRVAAEGRIAVSSDAGRAAIVEVNCETDFVANGDAFSDFAQGVADLVFNEQPADVAALAALPLGSGTVDERRRELIAKLGENMSVRRFAEVSGSTVGVYLHGARIGVVVALEGGSEELARDIAMHIAASNPLRISPDDMPAEDVAKEKEILVDQAKQSGKPMEIIEKMIVGRLKKWLAEVTLVGQPFVKDPDQTIEQLLAKHSAKVVAFQRLEVGEGIEKKEEDFAAEVMAQVKGS